LWGGGGWGIFEFSLFFVWVGGGVVGGVEVEVVGEWVWVREGKGLDGWGE
jgi:hypothetical protein